MHTAITHISLDVSLCMFFDTQLFSKISLPLMTTERIASTDEANKMQLEVLV